MGLIHSPTKPNDAAHAWPRKVRLCPGIPTSPLMSLGRVQAKHSIPCTSQRGRAHSTTCAMTTIILSITIIVALCMWAGYEFAKAMALTGCEDGVVPVGAIVMNAEVRDLGMPIGATRCVHGWSVDADDPLTSAVLAEMEALYGYDPMLPEAAWAAMEDMATATFGRP